MKERDQTMVGARPDGITRKLSAILCADIHGYTRLMDRDEAGTVVRLTRSLALIRNLVVDYGGAVVNIAGDWNLSRSFQAQARRCILPWKCKGNCPTNRRGPTDKNLLPTGSGLLLEIPSPAKTGFTATISNWQPHPRTRGSRRNMHIGHRLPDREELAPNFPCGHSESKR